MADDVPPDESSRSSDSDSHRSCPCELPSKLDQRDNHTMPQVRRRVLRPVPVPSRDARDERRCQRLRAKLAADQVTLRRWMSRLKRAFHAVERLQAGIARCEKQLSR
jgi:hypothetical protein